MLLLAGDRCQQINGVELANSISEYDVQQLHLVVCTVVNIWREKKHWAVYSTCHARIKSVVTGCGLGSQNGQKCVVGRDPFQTPLGELTALHRPPSWTKEKGGENEGSEGREEGDEDSKGGKEVEEG